MRSFDEFLKAKNEVLDLGDLRAAVRGSGVSASEAPKSAAEPVAGVSSSATSKPPFGKKGKMVGKKDTTAQPQVNQQGEVDLNAFKKS